MQEYNAVGVMIVGENNDIKNAVAGVINEALKTSGFTNVTQINDHNEPIVSTPVPSILDVMTKRWPDSLATPITIVSDVENVDNDEVFRAKVTLGMIPNPESSTAVVNAVADRYPSVAPAVLNTHAQQGKILDGVVSAVRSLNGVALAINNIESKNLPWLNYKLDNVNQQLTDVKAQIFDKTDIAVRMISPDGTVKDLPWVESKLSDVSAQLKETVGDNSLFVGDLISATFNDGTTYEVLPA